MLATTRKADRLGIQRQPPKAKGKASLFTKYVILKRTVAGNFWGRKQRCQVHSEPSTGFSGLGC